MDKDLVYFKQGIPAWQQMDKYSNNPWMLLSKNADIFSSSNSYKATAFSSPDSQASNIFEKDDRGRIVLKTNWDIIDTWDNNRRIINVYTAFEDNKLPVSYNYSIPSASSLAEFWNLRKLIVKYDKDDPREIVVFSDRTKFTYSFQDFNDVFSVDSLQNCTLVQEWNITKVKLDTTDTSTMWTIVLKSTWHWVHYWNLKIYRDTDVNYGNVIKVNNAFIKWYRIRYNAELDRMESATTSTNLTIEWDTTLYRDSWVAEINYVDSDSFEITIKVKYSTYANQTHEPIIITSPWSYKYFFEYLPLDENRIVKDIWEYYFTKWTHSASLLAFEWERVGTGSNLVTRYLLNEYMAYDFDADTTPVDCVVFDEKVYLICNKDWNWYIYPCDLSWGKGTPYIAYWVEFKSAIVLNYLIYLVWENRWVSTLFVYSWTELVHIIEGNKKADWLPDYIDNDEQYKFNGMIADWRWLLVLGTTDNRIFCYWQTFWGRWGSFIHSLASWQTLKEIRTIWKDLYIKYTESWVLKTIKYQNDTAIKNYNTDFEIVYPVIIGSHMIEKEVYDLYCSYILPSSDCSLEFWLAVNHYYFWTFRLPSKPTIAEWDEYFLSWATGTNVWLTFVEKDSANWEWYTFRLSKNLPVQNSYLTANMKLYKPVEWWSNIEVAYTEFNHFKKIGEITADKYKEWYDRFNNINTKNWFPRTHSLQLMVRGKWTVNYTPEVFWVNLVSNQRDRW